MTSLLPPGVLVVDDDPDHARIAALVVASLAPGLAVRCARDAASALGALEAQPRGALVLVDRVLAGVESFDAVARMHALRPDVTIVMLSAALSSTDRAYALACGARDAIEKPGCLAGWRDVLGALLGTGQPSSSRAA